ncbi:hypothetical protein OHO28_08225 [Streptomyces europaeiscabiei]|uniref:hypothetical protein n=1 Tax=Streptomyces europaeiscabiei TaxID=146819 RepID=UPI002E192750
MTSEPIRITRGAGGEVEVEGLYDEFAARILSRAGFMTFPTLRGQWVRLPFDLGRAWENEHACWAGDMLTAARYRVDLDPDLRPAPPAASEPPAARRAKTAQPVRPVGVRRQHR